MRRGLTLGAVLAVMAAGAVSADDKPLHIYSQFKGAEMVLDVVNGGQLDNFVHLMPKADVSGQNWIMIPDAEGTFRLTTQFRGKDMCLDVVRDSSKGSALRAAGSGGGPDGFLKLTPCGNHEGQYWTMVDDNGALRAAGQDDGGWLKLRPQFWRHCLDVVNGGQLDGFVRMTECGDNSGQHWKME